MNTTTNGTVILSEDESTKAIASTLDANGSEYPEEGGYSLSDGWRSTGTNLEDFKALVDDVSERTVSYTVPITAFTVVSHAENTVRGDGNRISRYRVLAPENLQAFESTGSLKVEHKRTCVDMMMNEDNEALLEEEALHSHIHLINADLTNTDLPAHLYMYPGAVAQMLTVTGMAADNNISVNSLCRDVFLAKKLYGKKDVTLLTRSVKKNGKSYTKVFGVVSSKYQRIEMSVLYKCVELLEKTCTLGEVSVKSWFMDQDFTEIRIEFPEAAEEFTTSYGLPDKLVPGIRLCAGDTGKSSVIIEPTFRLTEGLAIGEESVRQIHKGNVTEEEILKAVDAQVLTKLKEFPEALLDRLAVSIGSFDLDTAEGRMENKRLVFKCIKAGMKELKIYQVLGKARKKLTLERLKSEIQADKRYSEYDISLIIMGLSERINFGSRDMSVKLAKACGKAATLPYLELALHDDEDDDFFIDDPVV